MCVLGKENIGMGSFFSQYNTLRERDFGLTHPNPSLTFAGCVIPAFHLYIGNHNSMHLLELLL